MEIFYSNKIVSGICILDGEESAHCVRVLRHRCGDEIYVIDGEGTLYTCTLVSDSPKCAEARVKKVEPDWGSHPYFLQMAVCPTKNNERFEWFAEKATELGVDRISPVIGEHSERKVYKTERLRRILLSASKQSLKGAIPDVDEPVSVSEFIGNAAGDADALKCIACCFEGEVPRISINEFLEGARGRRIMVLIGPEGDFSREETRLAVESGFVPVHLGPSRLRTETAALTAVSAVYMKFLCI
ncbi:MAG: 16S rRNA (uracil(1498)-N(3))-methyltransferase [Bacteroidales bacterium]|nr:16S rRNA (uracil(1498)-N(3))-methyltransferase [Bacteroidales bacterium]